MEDCPRHTLKLTPLFSAILKKLKRRDLAMLKRLDGGIAKILKRPSLGKPLGNVLRNYRRIHIEGSFVLLYAVNNCEVRLVDFDHHDKIYKKYS